MALTVCTETEISSILLGTSCMADKKPVIIPISYPVSKCANQWNKILMR